MSLKNIGNLDDIFLFKNIFTGLDDINIIFSSKLTINLTIIKFSSFQDRHWCRPSSFQLTFLTCLATCSSYGVNQRVNQNKESSFIMQWCHRFMQQADLYRLRMTLEGSLLKLSKSRSVGGVGNDHLEHIISLQDRSTFQEQSIITDLYGKSDFGDNLLLLVTEFRCW